MNDTTIGFIGGGNMARALIGGLLAAGVEPASISVSDPDTASRDGLARLGVQAHADNQAVVDRCQVVVLAVKPQLMKPVLTALQPGKVAGQFFLSIAAGIRTASLNAWLGDQVPVVRAMPNTPALVQSAATALYATPRVADAQKDQAESVMRAAGLVLWLDEETQMDAVTALSGSGPAYFFYVMEAMEKAGTALGLPHETARLLSIQTAFGAARLALEIEEEPALLRENVTSPGGTTEQAIRVLQQGGLEKLFAQAMTAARDRAVELADELGQ